MIMIRALVILLSSYYANSLSTVVYGPETRDLLLLTSKLAAREGIETSLICAADSEQGCLRLMYGEEEGQGEGKAKPISSGDDMQNALTNANSMILISYDNPLDANAVNTLLGAAGENLSKVVLLSKMGVTKGGGGGFFGGGGDAKLLQAETAIRDFCKEKELDLSIVRAGHVLKGGGPGDEGNDFGLDRCYYNTIFDAAEAAVTMAHDKYTLGAVCTSGDSVETPNMMTKMGTKSSFDPLPYDTNRIIAASATVAALLYDETPIEFSVGTEKGRAPPSREEWNEMLSNL